MNVKNQDLLVNADELKLLTELLIRVDDSDGQNLEFDISCAQGGESLLSHLGFANDLQLVANYGIYHLVFPVQIEKGDFANFSLKLKSPEIFEIGDKLRAWRLPADKTIRLVNEAGEESHYQIKDISASGISLLVNQETKTEFPEELQNIYLLLPNRERLSISGAHISRIDETAVAYSLGTQTDKLVLASLSEYLYECHVRQHPEAHVNNPKEKL